MANIGYTLDSTGKNPANKVSETRTLTRKAIDGRAFVVPKASPFFAESVKIISNGKILVEDKDYHLILVSEELSAICAKKIVGGILFNTVNVNTSVTFEVQTIGGDFNLPIGNTVETLTRLIRNPSFTTFSQLVGTPVGLPTFDHNAEWGSTVDYAGFINKFDQLILILLNMTSGGGDASGFLQALNNHLNSTTAHDKKAVGLGNVMNYAIAQDEDFNNKPYLNTKYVTPRTVMYAIDRYIGTVLETQTRTISELSETVSSNTQAYRQLLNQWEDLSLTLQGINNNYQQMVNTVNSYREYVQRLEIEYRTINEQQKSWLDTVTGFSKNMETFTNDYRQIIETKQQLIDSFARLESAYTDFQQIVSTLSTTTTAHSKQITDLEKHNLYPTSKVLTSGSMNFKIKPGQKFSITLIGAGGGVGDYVTDAPSFGAVYNGEHGGSTILHCLQDITNGEYTPSPDAFAIAGGGFGGIATYGSNTGVVNSYGIGGRGGTFKFPINLVPLEASNGEGGIKGYGTYVRGQLSTQETGYDYFGHKWGRGAITEQAIGQGGEGAIVRFEFENKLKVDLEFMVSVGVAGRSYTPDKSNATGGLAIIKLIK